MEAVFQAHQAAFAAAAKCGDLQTVCAHFKDPSVLENVAAWNAEHRAQRLGITVRYSFRHRRFLPKPWFAGAEHGKNLFATNIVYHGQVEVFRWFFLPTQVELMVDTLRFMATHIASACLFAQTASSFEMIEIFVKSHLFTEIMDDEERRSLLGTLLCTATSRGFDEWVHVLVAHGADPNFKHENDTPLTAMAEQGDPKTLDALLAHGAWLEGDKSALLLAVVARNEQLAAHLLRHGDNANSFSDDNTSALHQAVRLVSPMIVGRLVLEGYADVDARDEGGRTPLLIVASGGNGYRNVQSKIQTVELLLEGGANIHAVDENQCGVLHYAMCDQDLRCLHLFLEHGADPNHQDANGRTPISALLLHAGHGVRGPIVCFLDVMLQAGADPYMPDHSGVSAVQILEPSDSGWAYIAEKRQFFRHHAQVFGDTPP